MRDATDRIELLGDTLIPPLDTPGVAELLVAKATHGCGVRILVYDAGRHLAPLVDQAGIEIRVLEVPAPHTIHRFDEQLLLILHLLGRDAERAPLLHLRRAGPGGMFDRFTGHYNDLWEQESQPIKPDVDLAVDEEEEEDEDGGENPESPPSLLAAEQPAADRREPSAPPPRRWPRRPT